MSFPTPVLPSLSEDRLQEHHDSPQFDVLNLANLHFLKSDRVKRSCKVSHSFCVPTGRVRLSTRHSKYHQENSQSLSYVITARTKTFGIGVGIGDVSMGLVSGKSGTCVSLSQTARQLVGWTYKDGFWSIEMSYACYDCGKSTAEDAIKLLIDSVFNRFDDEKAVLARLPSELEPIGLAIAEF
jgi:hypothetical protein